MNLPVLPSGETLEEAYFPDYILNPEMDMPEKEVDGQKYIGVLRIPALLQAAKSSVNGVILG